jgi:hypothetical protein
VPLLAPTVFRTSACIPITFSALPRIRFMFQRFIQAINFPPGWRAPRVPWGVSKLI